MDSLHIPMSTNGVNEYTEAEMSRRYRAAERILRVGNEGTIMPVLRWDDFNNTHVRPYMIFADIGLGHTRFDLLRQFAVAMAPQGDLAMLPEGGFIRLGFELDTDAEKFAAAVQAKRTAREGGWAGQWAFAFDKKTANIIQGLLPTKLPIKPRLGTPRKRRRRESPF